MSERDLGMHIRRLRVEAGMRQEELVSRINDSIPKAVSRTTISGIERGGVIPKLSTAYLIAEVLNCDIVEMCEILLRNFEPNSGANF